MKKLNYFGQKIYSPYEILTTNKINRILINALKDIFKELKIRKKESDLLLSEIFNVDISLSQKSYEKKIKTNIAKYIKKDSLLRAFEKRAKIIAKQIDPFLKGTSVLDVGCGDGLVLYYSKKRDMNIMLTDIYGYLDKRVKDKFVLFNEYKNIPIKHIYDTTLLLTVLHHSQNPIRVLKQVKKVTKGRVIIIESVYAKKKETPKSSKLLNDLDIKSQRKYASFVDWFYNRIVHDNVQVPYNFRSPEQWTKIFKLQGWKIIKSVDLGIDQKIVPERHYLFIIER